jgi:LysM repeat protein
VNEANIGQPGPEKAEDQPPADEANNDQSEQPKVILDVSLFAFHVLDSDKIGEDAASGPLYLEVPDALVRMIQKALAGDDELLNEFVYAYLLATKKEKQQAKSRFRRIIRMDKQELRTEAKKAVKEMTTVFAPLIEGVREESPELSTQGPPTAADRSTSESSQSESNPESGERPEASAARYPIQKYKASIPVQPEALAKLRQIYTKLLSLPENELYDMYFLQVYHALRYGVAASPQIQRWLVALGTRTVNCLYPLMCPEGLRPSGSPPEGQVADQLQTARDILETLERTYTGDLILEELRATLFSGMVDLTISFFWSGGIELAPVLIAATTMLMISIICHVPGPPAVKVLLGILLLIAVILLILELRKWRETSTLSSTAGPVCLSCPPPVVYVVPPTVIAPVAVPPPAPMQFTQPPESGVCIYVVQPGDTPQAIAARFQVSEDTLRATNPTLGIGVFRIHQKLMISAPCCRPIGRQGISHTVQRRETLYSIARRYGTTLESIAWANHIYDLNYIQEGQMLCIP